MTMQPNKNNGHGGPPMSFSMPMMNDFVPHFLRPWIYLIIACCFQISSARYLGPLNEIIGADSLMREDVMMCMYCNLAGMAVWFPMLFRMKFRFTNKTLLCASSVVVIITNILTGYVTFLPLLWFICFVEGIAKIQGTFECMSNIQLWMTPKRDMTIFFPLLHIVILSGMNWQDMISSYWGYLGDWRLMHYLIIGVHCLVLLFLTTCTHHFRFMKLPLYGIDWTSMLLWSALLMQCAYVFDYGEWYSWFDSNVVWTLVGCILIMFSLILWRMGTIRHPYISPKVFTSFRYVKHILALIVLVEAILGTEYVLEELFLEEGLHYSTMNNAWLCLPVWIGNICGCIFSLVWLQKVLRFSYIRLGIIGTAFMGAYIIYMYLFVSPDLSREMLWLPLFCRGFAYTTLSIMFFASLHDLMDFNHFFQGLSVFNMLHMVIGGCLGCAIYSKALNYYIVEGMARYGTRLTLPGISRMADLFSGGLQGNFMSGFMQQISLYAIKNIYGWVCFVCLALLLGFLMFDSPIRRGRSYMIPWRVVGIRLKRYLNL